LRLFFETTAYVPSCDYFWQYNDDVTGRADSVATGLIEAGGQLGLPELPSGPVDVRLVAALVDQAGATKTTISDALRFFNDGN